MRLSEARARKKHPGFKAVEAQIGRETGIRNPGAVLEAGRRKASPAAVAANPALRKVPTAGSHRTKGGFYR